MRSWWRFIPLVSELLMGVAMLTVAVNLVLTGNGLSGRVASGIWLVSMAVFVASVTLQRRILARERRAGAWDERFAIFAAAQEAADRGMSPGEFVAAYMDKVSVEGMAEFGPPPQDVPGGPDRAGDSSD